MIAIPLPAVEVVNASFSPFNLTGTVAHVIGGPSAPAAGSRTARGRVVSEHWGNRSATLVFEGPAGTTAGYYLLVRRRLLPTLKVDCPDVRVTSPDGSVKTVPCTAMIDTAHRDPNLPFLMTPQIPPGEGWKTITVTLTW
jgi:hypothetical protein